MLYVLCGGNKLSDLTCDKILKVEHRFLVAVNIRENIQIWLQGNQPLPEDEKEPCPFQFGSLYLGSRQDPCSLGELELVKAGDLAYTDFASRLSTFVNDNLLPDGSPKIRYLLHDKVGHVF